MTRFPGLRRSSLAVVVMVALFAGACAAAATRTGVPAGTAQPDQYLYDKGTAALQAKKWVVARGFFHQLEDSYSQSPLRPEAKLAVGDTYLGEGSTESLVLAINEFQEFLSYYPTSPRADYAQYKLAFAHVRQMRNAERDQSETRSALKELDTFVARYPNSPLMPEVKAKLREAHDRLSMADYLVGVFYFRSHWYPGAIDRLSAVLKQDPEFSGRDGVYYYLGEALIPLKREAESLTYYEKLVAEFQQSDFLEKAKKRIAEMKAQAAAKETS